jgi:glutathione S-transferase
VIPLRESDTREAILRYSPSGKLPVLLHGDVTVWDSLAICEYVAEQFPDAGLWPAEANTRAHARAVAAEMHSGFLDLRRNMPMNICSSLPGLGMTPEVQGDINRITAIWRECRKNSGGEFLFGDFTIADAMFAAVVSRLVTYGVELDENAHSYVDAIMGLPMMQAWVAEAKDEPWIIPDFEF